MSLSGGWVAFGLASGLLSIALTASGAQSPPASVPKDTIWEPLALPTIRSGSTRADSLSDMAIERQGSLWIMANASLFYWTGSEFKEPSGVALNSGQYLTGLYGGQDRDLIATQVASRDGRHGELYRLQDGTATRVADFQFDERGRYPGLYVAKTGQIVNWGQNFVAAWNGVEWNRIDARADPPRDIVLETESAVHLLSGRRLYTVDRDGSIRDRELTAGEGDAYACGVVWGDNRALLFDNKRHLLTAWDLTTLEPVDISGIRSALANPRWTDLIRAPDGSAWILSRSSVFSRLTPRGDVIPLPATGQLNWSGLRARHYPHSVFFCRDGAVWFCSEAGGLFRYENDRMERYSWPQGVFDGGGRFVLQDDRGNVFAGYPHALFVARSGGRRVPVPSWTRAWAEHPLASHRPLQDESGRLWMALAAHPWQLSCWDGRQFTHRDAPLDTTRILGLLVDDQDHLLVYVVLGFLEARWFDVGPESSEEFGDDFEAVLVAAVKRGARRFVSDESIRGPLVDERGGIWYASAQESRVRVFDGRSWSDVPGHSFVFEAADHAIVVSDGERFERLDGDRWTTIPDAGLRKRFRMMGPDEQLGFEPSVYAASPEEFVAFDRSSNPPWPIVLPRLDPTDTNRPWTFEPKDGRPSNTSYGVIRGRLGSVLTGYTAGPIYRILGGFVFEARWRGTPLQGWGFTVRNVFDDNAGNLCIHRGTGPGLGGNSFFVKDCRRFVPAVPAPPEVVGASWSGEVTVPSADGDSTRPALLWRIDDGPWIRGSEPGRLEPTFSSAGRHRVQVVAVGPQAELSAPVELAFDVRLDDE